MARFKLCQKIQSLSCFHVGLMDMIIPLLIAGMVKSRICAQATTSKGISPTVTGSKSALGLPKPMRNSYISFRSVGILVQKFESIGR